MIAGKQVIARAVFSIPRSILNRPSRDPEVRGLLPSLTVGTFDDLSGPEVHGELPVLEDYLSNGLKIRNANPLAISSIGLDLTISDEIYKVPSLRTIDSLEQLRNLAVAGEIKKVDPKNGKVLLEADDSGRNIYYIVSAEEIALPSNFDMIVDARSNTGRLAVMCTDRPTKSRFTGESSPIIVAAQPYAFPIELRVGEDSLVQTIFRYKDTAFMTIEEVRADNAVDFIGADGNSLNGRTRFTRYGATLTFHTDKVLIAKPLAEIPGPIELARKAHYDITDFFEIREGLGQIEMTPRRFHLLGTRENIHLGNVCGLLSRETPDTGTGLWSHFAGFFWPGYQGPITMECRSEAPHLIASGDPAGYVVFDKMDGPLIEEKAYRGVFQDQKAPKAPKPFKEI